MRDSSGSRQRSLLLGPVVVGRYLIRFSGITPVICSNGKISEEMMREYVFTRCGSTAIMSRSHKSKIQGRDSEVMTAIGRF